MVVTFPPEASPSTFCWPLLHNRYQVLHDLGIHSQGSRVLRVLDTHTGKPFALKQMRMANLAHYEIREAARFFRQEALILQQVSHPRIPQLHEVWTQGQRWHLVMTFVEGETLETILKREGCLPPSRVLFYAIQLCEVLVYLHQLQPPVIHRDLKPANIIIDPKGDLWLIDFGIARYGQVAQHHQQVLAWRSEPRTGKGDTLPNLGTVGYAPPEQFGVPSYTTTRSDLYSFGAVLHHMLSGENPTQQAKKNLFTWRKLRIVPTRLGELIACLLDRDPEQRPQSAADVLQVLEKLAHPSREEWGSVVP